MLDEVDEMLNMGFVDDVETILSSGNKDVQTLLFSATMPPWVKCAQALRHPVLAWLVWLPPVRSLAKQLHSAAVQGHKAALHKNKNSSRAAWWPCTAHCV